MTASLFPFRFQPLERATLLVSEAGDLMMGGDDLLERMVAGQPSPAEAEVLLEQGFAYRTAGDFHWQSFVSRLRRRKVITPGLRHVIAIPTLRCDLSCGYCQAARARLDAKGVDWTAETEEAFFAFLGQALEEGIGSSGPLVVEFQGGEPTLRLDVILRTRRFLEERGGDWRMVLCTNLSRLSTELLELLEDERVLVSTSVDGPPDLHRRNRTETAAATHRFHANLGALRERFGNDRVSALPTILPRDYDRLPDVIEAYRDLGFDSLFLRPVSPHGFARRAGATRDEGADWRVAYARAIDLIFDMNEAGRGPLREYGLEVALRRIFWPGYTGHVDLRSPNPVGRDAIVVDHDGGLYPSDEARMLGRLRHVDLRIGDLWRGVDAERLRAMNWNQMGEVNEDCIHCAFQPFCGIDTIDDLARYDRIDLPRGQTRFCRDQTAQFTMIFQMLADGRPRDLMNLSGHLTGRFEAVPFFGPFFGPFRA